jgi:hypothetical protein
MSNVVSLFPERVVEPFALHRARRSPCRLINPQERPADVIPLRPMLHYDMTRNVFSNFWSDDEGSLSRQAALALAVAVSMHLHVLRCALTMANGAAKCLSALTNENFSKKTDEPFST